MSAVGGRLGALRSALADTAELDEAIVRNIYRGVAPEAGALAHTRQALLDVEHALEAQLPDMIVEGDAKW
jgi:cytochrome b pre-mRNA-processing protein 3